MRVVDDRDTPGGPYPGPAQSGGRGGSSGQNTQALGDLENLPPPPRDTKIRDFLAFWRRSLSPCPLPPPLPQSPTPSHQESGLWGGGDWEGAWKTQGTTSVLGHLPGASVSGALCHLPSLMPGLEWQQETWTRLTWADGQGGQTRQSLLLLPTKEDNSAMCLSSDRSWDRAQPSPSFLRVTNALPSFLSSPTVSSHFSSSFQSPGGSFLMWGLTCPPGLGAPGIQGAALS